MKTTLAKTQTEKIDDSCINYKDAHNSCYKKFTKLGDWLEKESSTFKNESNNIKYLKPNFKRGQIIRVDFGINMGSELSDVHFAIVLNSDDNNSVDNLTVLPLTSKKGYKRLLLGNTILYLYRKSKSKSSYALITQITTISKNKIFNDNIKCFCDKNLLKKIDDEIIKHITKK